MPNELTAGQVARRLKVSTRTVARLYLRGHFPNAHKHGEHPNAPLVIPEADLIAYEKKLALKPSKA